MAERKQKDSLRDGSFPDGMGGRVHVPIHRGPNGEDMSIDPVDGNAYSGMLKRQARQTGYFTREAFDELDSDV